MSILFNMLWYAWNPPADPKGSFEGKTVLVTGANVGIGYEAAIKFAALGVSRVILGVRDSTKGQRAKADIEAKTGKKGVVEVWPLDMNSYDSIQALARRAWELPRLDVAVLNAGVHMPAYEPSPYGWEETLQVNMLSTALLAILLLPKLRASRRDGEAPPALEIVGSGSHKRTSIPPEKRTAAGGVLRAYNDRATYASYMQYGVSKVLVQLLVQKLAELTRRPGTSGEPDVLVLAVCPGMTKSALGRGHMTSWVMQVGMAVLFSTMARTTEQGSRTIVSGVLQGPEAHGRFWQHDEIQP